MTPTERAIRARAELDAFRLVQSRAFARADELRAEGNVIPAHCLREFGRSFFPDIQKAEADLSAALAKVVREEK